MGFEPTPTYMDQKPQPVLQARCTLESGALDRSATLTADTQTHGGMMYSDLITTLFNSSVHCTCSDLHTNIVIIKP